MKSVKIMTFYRLSDEDIQSVRKQYGITDEIEQLKQLIVQQQYYMQNVMAQQFSQIQKIAQHQEQIQDQIQTLMNMLSQGQSSQSADPAVQNNAVSVSPKEPSAPERKETSADSFRYRENRNGEMIIIEYIGKAKKVVIPQKINGKPIITIGNNAFKECQDIVSVDIPDSITSIGDSAFESCWRITDMDIPNSVTDIGHKAFFCCHNLTIYCEKGSYAERYAKKMNIPVSYV